MWSIPYISRVKIGGSYFTDVIIPIQIDGQNIFRLKRREDGLLALDFDIYDAKGSKIATVRNGNIVQHDRRRFRGYKEHHRYWITERRTGRVIFDIRKVSKAEEGTELEVMADLYTKKGVRLFAGRDFIRVDGVLAREVHVTKCLVGINVNSPLRPHHSSPAKAG